MEFPWCIEYRSQCNPISGAPRLLYALWRKTEGQKKIGSHGNSLIDSTTVHTDVTRMYAFCGIVVSWCQQSADLKFGRLLTDTPAVTFRLVDKCWWFFVCRPGLIWQWQWLHNTHISDACHYYKEIIFLVILFDRYFKYCFLFLQRFLSLLVLFPVQMQSTKRTIRITRSSHGEVTEHFTEVNFLFGIDLKFLFFIPFLYVLHTCFLSDSSFIHGFYSRDFNLMENLDQAKSFTFSENRNSNNKQNYKPQSFFLHHDTPKKPEGQTHSCTGKGQFRSNSKSCKIGK